MRKKRDEGTVNSTSTQDHPSSSGRDAQPDPLNKIQGYEMELLENVKLFQDDPNTSLKDVPSSSLRDEPSSSLGDDPKDFEMEHLEDMKLTQDHPSSSLGDDPAHPLLEIEGFEIQLLDEVKSGFKPMAVRDQGNTIYPIPERISEGKRKIYNSRYQYFGIVASFDKMYEKSRMNNLHILAHMKSILSRNQNNTFEDYLLAMHAVKDEIRMCYLAKITMDFKRLMLLVLGCCHILDVLLLFYEGRLTPQVDHRCSSKLQVVCMDMLFLQGQVPFFALQKIFDMLNLDRTRYPSLIDLCLNLYKEFLDINEQLDPMLTPESVHHLLHLVHHHLRPSDNSCAPQRSKHLFLTKLRSLILRHPSSVLPTSAPPSLSRSHTPLELRQSASHPSLILPNSSSELSTTPPPPSQIFSLPLPELSALDPPPKKPHTVLPIPPARRLQAAGIKFKKKATTGFSSITFHRGVLEIPYLRIDNHTEILLQTMVAWEQCHPNVGGYFTSYAIFMDFIINTAEDVEILNHYGIIEQTLGQRQK